MVRDHLLVRGFMDGYRWEGDEDDYEFVHGISTRNKEGGEHHVEVPGHDQDVEDPGHDHDHNVGDHGPDDMEDQDGGPDDEDHEDEDDGPSSMDWVQDPYLQELLLKQTSNARDAAREKAKMDQLEVDAVTPLYEGCRPEDTRLKVTLMALEMKHAECTICPECGVSRYKKGKKAPRKVVWYFPITPRLQRYFADPKQAKLMRWHAEMRKGEDDVDDPKKKKKDRMLRHPSDASQWNALNLEYPEFGDDPRNIRLGASTDGVNPFGSQSSTHSTWPVFVWMYNLPPVVHEEEVHSNDLDVMHIMKNVCESLLGTLLNMPERTKDGPKARYDLLSIGIREELHAGRPNDDDDDDDDDNDDDEAEDTQSRRKGKKAKKIEYYAPRASL
ncbi:hypothetical protein QYE76_056819 [Lolium multiflorum]|uniref:Uncharacterized protein n=1 Tax=Lolium multiflorum TaxID=4521 RepID=A0AAD8T389_LOLMU|nr:hypothetical protein QYE76_056819 [Lolium multiflorum]